MKTINFTQSYLDMQGVEILGQKKTRLINVQTMINEIAERLK